MKTPEQVAADVYWTLADDALPDSPNGDDYRSIMIAAIEADRAQRADLLKREADTLGFYYRNAEDMTSPEGFIDKKGERYDRGDLMHNMARAREAMLLAIGMDATEAFREAFK